MGTVIKFHVRTSSGAPSWARDSSVIPEMPRSAANRDSGSQWAAGIPRPRSGARQQLTVEGASESASATAFVPPSASITKSDVIMDPNIVCSVQTCQGFATRKTTFSADCGAIGSMMDPPHVISRRLKALRVELGFKSQVSFADALGIDKSTYNPFEKGSRPLTFETACLIRRKFGISIDWLFFGDLQQASLQMMAKIGRAAEAPAQKVRKTVNK